MVEAIYGCKSPLTVYRPLANGLNRPGEMVRSVEGLATKLLNDCLRRNLEFGIINRVAYPEIPPRVEYEITDFGRRFIRILGEIEKLQCEIETKWLTNGWHSTDRRSGRGQGCRGCQNRRHGQLHLAKCTR